MNVESFSAWLDAYGKAWEESDGEAFVALFAPDVRYYWTPFDEKRGRAEIVAAFIRATAIQEQIRFEHSVLAVGSNAGIARWSCSFVRIPAGPAIQLDGVLRASFVQPGICGEFREWWHTREVKRSGR